MTSQPKPPEGSQPADAHTDAGADASTSTVPGPGADAEGVAGETWPAAGEPPFASGDSSLIVDVDGFEGPLDLLLAMARTQKVDLARISVLALAEQYISFIDQSRRLKIELAADYLVMAAWLAFLKSRLLLPAEEDEDANSSAEEMAQRLSFRLMRLEAMRNAAAQLMNRSRFGRDIFARGAPEGFARIRDTSYTAGLFDLLKAYALQRQRTIKVVHTVKKRTVWSIKDARRRLQNLIGDFDAAAWLQLDMFIERYLLEPEDQRTARAASFGATLEMAREGLVELRQAEPFAPIYMRKCNSHGKATGAWKELKVTTANEGEQT